MALVDINECTNSGSICDHKPNSHCENTIGSYSCRCNTGYTQDGDKCVGTFGFLCACSTYPSVLLLSCDHFRMYHFDLMSLRFYFRTLELWKLLLALFMLSFQCAVRCCSMNSSSWFLQTPCIGHDIQVVNFCICSRSCLPFLRAMFFSFSVR